MKLYLKTADDVCQIWLDDTKFEWKSERNLSKGLLKFLQQSLEKQKADWSDIDSIVVFRGPGSYTGLRIGLTVANTLADGLEIPIVGTQGNNWQTDGDELLKNNQNHQIVTPIYYQPAVITSPRK